MHLRRGPIQMAYRSLAGVCIVGFLTFIPALHGLAADSPQTKETVRGTSCYRYGDNETFNSAREAAITLALKQAIRGHRVFVESSSRVKNFQLDEDIIAATSFAMLKDTVIEKEERKPQEVCVGVTASLNPASTEELIRQRVAAKEVAMEAAAAAVPALQNFGLKVWTNKSTNSFVENERLIIYVKSERDAFLKLDYFQANGSVAHLVPNLYRGQAHVTAGKTYAFGEDTAPEHFIVQEPYGDEVIKAIASVTPFDLSNEPVESVSDSRAYIKANLRGIKVIGAESSVPLKTERMAAQQQQPAPAAPARP